VPGATDISLLVPNIEDAYEIYWNGRLIGSFGKLPPHPMWHWNPPPQIFKLERAGAGVLAIRVWTPLPTSLATGKEGGFSAPILAGNAESIAAAKDSMLFAKTRRIRISESLYTLYGLVALASFAFWLRDRSQWLLFWTGCFLASAFLDVVFANWMTSWSSGVDIGLARAGDAIGDIGLWYLLCWLLDLRGHRTLMRVTRIAAMVLISVSVVDCLVLSVGWGLSWGPGWASAMVLANAGSSAMFTVLAVYNLAPVAVALYYGQRVDHSRWLVAGTTAFAQTFYLLGFALPFTERYTHWTLSETLRAPLFSIHGAEISIQMIFDMITLAALIYAVFRYSAEVSQRKNALEQEFKHAREVQQILIPDALPEIPGFMLTSAYIPAEEVGGDFFQIIPLEDGSTLVLVGDVSGKGLKAAMSVSLIVGAVRTAAETISSPAEILATLNRRLCGRLNDGFATALALRLESDGRCTIAAAGHPAPFLNESEVNLPGTLPLGLVVMAAYEEVSVLLGAGDHMSLYTDGLVEARSATGELFSFGRLQALLASRPTAEEASKAAVSFGQDDDITVLTLTRLGTESEVAQKSMTVLAPAELTA
jgi:hypothetical protein